MDYEIRFYDHEGVYIVPVTGDYDMSNADVLDSTVQAALKSGNAVVIDFRTTRYIDSTILALLVRQKKQEGGRVQIVVPPDAHVRKIFDITGLYVGLSIADSIEAAIVNARVDDAGECLPTGR